MDQLQIKWGELPFVGADVSASQPDPFAVATRLKLPFYWDEQTNDWVSFAHGSFDFWAATYGAMSASFDMSPPGEQRTFALSVNIPTFCYVFAACLAYFPLGGFPTGCTLRINHVDDSGSTTRFVDIPVPDDSVLDKGYMSHLLHVPIMAAPFDKISVTLISASSQLPVDPNLKLLFRYRLPRPGELSGRDVTQVPA